MKTPSVLLLTGLTSAFMLSACGDELSHKRHDTFDHVFSETKVIADSLLVADGGVIDTNAVVVFENAIAKKFAQPGIDVSVDIAPFSKGAAMCTIAVTDSTGEKDYMKQVQWAHNRGGVKPERHI